MNKTLMDYLSEHHRLLQILDEGREEDEELNDSLITLINTLLELVSQLTEDINEHHQLELVLDIAKADSSTQDNLEKLDISQPDEPEATGEKTFQPQYPSLKDMTENQSETTDFSSATLNAPVEFLDIDTMEPLMQSNYNNPLHNPEGDGKIINTTTDPGDTADTADTGEEATTNSPPSSCGTKSRN